MMRESFKGKEIPSVSYYAVPLHLQPVFAHLGHKTGDFPITEKVANQCLSISMSPYLTKESLTKILNTIVSS